ncbi:hypothetical protein EJ357_33600 [Streptomyces cyaneochromogenes]|uniref:Uncharacterized protein n=1 Tax=Streptomyces cyaneochromogenes TaxID=2496836 RepID=A0A3Q9EXB9_9ACTN|nr:hypothetical protein [Streptomyces cyaneochromogenes]AZQ37789.1 hypothetical protein EJ357_33600 [Streptomyces cyaneochromogenes]
MPSPTYRSTPPAKPKGRARKVVGVLLLVFCVLPLLGTALTVYKTIKSAKEQNSNDEFIPKAWHNLRSDEIFPARIATDSTVGGAKIWARQGIAKESSCKEAFPADFADNVMESSCKLVLRATYTDLGGDMAATIGLVVAKSSGTAKVIDAKISKEQSEGVGEARLPTVLPFAVPGTQTADWGEKAGIGGASAQVFLPDSPYTVTTTTGPTDPARSVGQLPEPWGFVGYEERYPYRDVAKALATIYASDLRRTVLGK